MFYSFKWLVDESEPGSGREAILGVERHPCPTTLPFLFLFSPPLSLQPLALCEHAGPQTKTDCKPSSGSESLASSVAAVGASALSQLLPMKGTLLLYELGLTFPWRSSETPGWPFGRGERRRSRRL